MKLIDLLSIIPEENTVVVSDYDGEVEEIYDGKNSISPVWNNKEIARVDAGYYRICITILL